MIENLVVGCLTMAFCLVIQCVIVELLLRSAYHVSKRRWFKPTFWTSSGILIAIMLAMLLGNLLQISLWGALFFLFGEFGDYDTAFYHSAVNFSTLGYGDLVMSEERRLLGALEAVNGVLMFALTASFLFLILSDFAQREWDGRLSREEGGGPPGQPDADRAS